MCRRVARVCVCVFAHGNSSISPPPRVQEAKRAAKKPRHDGRGGDKRPKVGKKSTSRTAGGSGSADSEKQKQTAKRSGDSGHDEHEREGEGEEDDAGELSRKRAKVAQASSKGGNGGGGGEQMARPTDDPSTAQRTVFAKNLDFSVRA